MLFPVLAEEVELKRLLRLPCNICTWLVPPDVGLLDVSAEGLFYDMETRGRLPRVVDESVRQARISRWFASEGEYAIAKEYPATLHPYIAVHGSNVEKYEIEDNDPDPWAHPLITHRRLRLTREEEALGKYFPGWTGNLLNRFGHRFHFGTGRLSDRATIQRVALVRVAPGLMEACIDDEQERRRECALHPPLTQCGRWTSTDIAMPEYMHAEVALATDVSRIGWKRFDTLRPWKPPPGITPL